MNPDDDFWSNRFHHCALAAGFLAASEGRLDDSRYVQQLAYSLYEQRAFRGREVDDHAGPKVIELGFVSDDWI
jgi:hypothetical protein